MNSSNPRNTVKCKTCGYDSCHGNLVFDHIKHVTYEICARCRNRL
jgi:hypothetical protein